MPEIKGPVTINVNTHTHTDGASVVINPGTNEELEFPYFVMVGFADGGEYVASNCTIAQVVQGLSRLHDLYDKLKTEAQVNGKTRLRILPTITKKD
ncbi:MAG: hypothetical protein P4L59_11605 [Desulfosporosinus sp.]|nr:hypothetical protein [Desulfosporosinus sp.]